MDGSLTVWPEKVVIRFWEKVPFRPAQGCWEFHGSDNGKGYRSFYVNRRERWYAHRMSWALSNNRLIPEGLVVMHQCDNRGCVRPSHLRLGTYKENTADMLEKGRWINGGAKLSAAIAEEVRERYAAGGISQQRLGADYGVTQVTISHITRGLAWVA